MPWDLQWAITCLINLEKMRGELVRPKGRTLNWSLWLWNWKTTNLLLSLCKGTVKKASRRSMETMKSFLAIKFWITSLFSMRKETLLTNLFKLDKSIISLWSPDGFWTVKTRETYWLQEFSTGEITPLSRCFWISPERALSLTGSLGLEMMGLGGTMEHPSWIL